MRLKRLDILRAVAILLVILFHAQLFDFTTRVGWVGVDLFFVLSGFLISGLLYSEYKRNQRINVARFFVRRGFKIYPGFYVLILATFVFKSLLWTGPSPPARGFLKELLFIQNYKFGVWGHTWSLAVEEHFYIGLAVLLFVLARFASDRFNPFRSIPLIFAFVAATCLLLRAFTVWVDVPMDFDRFVLHPTHDRIDALFFGVFLGYLHHFRPELIQKTLRSPRSRFAIAAISGLLLSVSYFLPRHHPLLLSFGVAAIYLGFGGVLLLCLEARGFFTGKIASVLDRIGSTCAYVGRHSYSIYLWHLPFLVTFPAFLSKFARVPLPNFAVALLDVAACCALGIFFAHLVEFPALKLRDRFFPPMERPSSRW